MPKDALDAADAKQDANGSDPAPKEEAADEAGEDVKAEDDANSSADALNETAV